MDNQAKESTPYMTIAEFAKYRNLSYWYISRLVKEKKIPVRYSGKKAIINVNMAILILEQEDGYSISPKDKLPIYSGKSRGVLAPKRQANN